ncbi:hypothetical protein A2U01_0071172, partial [Trifolium medium]|nr:hypothetical protein [Trifolium medium]
STKRQHFAQAFQQTPLVQSTPNQVVFAAEAKLGWYSRTLAR